MNEIWKSKIEWAIIAILAMFFILLAGNIFQSLKIVDLQERVAVLEENTSPIALRERIMEEVHVMTWQDFYEVNERLDFIEDFVDVVGWDVFDHKIEYNNFTKWADNMVIYHEDWLIMLEMAVCDLYNDVYNTEFQTLPLCAQ